MNVPCILPSRAAPMQEDVIGGCSRSVDLGWRMGRKAGAWGLVRGLGLSDADAV